MGSTLTVDNIKDSGDNTLVSSTGSGYTLASGVNINTSLASATFPAGGTGNAISIAIICDQKNASTDGGDFNSGDWKTRDLNTEIADPDGIVSVSSNQFTLEGAGTYWMQWSAPAYRVDQHQVALYDITGTAYIAYGSLAQSRSTDQTPTTAFGSYIHTISSSNTYEIRHRATVTKASNGFGTSVSWAVNKFCIVDIFKLK
jgi:hypothetical protein